MSETGFFRRKERRDKALYFMHHSCQQSWGFFSRLISKGYAKGQNNILPTPLNNVQFFILSIGNFDFILPSIYSTVNNVQIFFG